MAVHLKTNNMDASSKKTWNFAKKMAKKVKKGGKMSKEIAAREGYDSQIGKRNK